MPNIGLSFRQRPPSLSCTISTNRNQPLIYRMKAKTLVSLAAALAASLTFQLHAADAPEAAKQEKKAQPAYGERTLESEAAFRKEMLSTYDKDGKGYLNVSEQETMLRDFLRYHQQFMSATDENKDGDISKTELAHARKILPDAKQDYIGKYDKNGDGSLSRKEWERLNSILEKRIRTYVDTFACPAGKCACEKPCDKTKCKCKPCGTDKKECPGTSTTK